MKVTLSIIVISILIHVCVHLMIVFHRETTNKAVEKVLEDTHKYVRYQHMLYFFRNMFYLYIALILLWSAFANNLKVIHNSETTEINVNAK